MILYNPTDKDITNYRVEEATLDVDGNTINNSDGTFLKTGRTLEWSIKAGEKGKVPDYVGTYLKKVYDFLEVVIEDGTKDAPKVAESKPAEGSIICKFCGQPFKNQRAIGLHWGARHYDQIR
jgi:hypothetical protein